MSGWGTGTMMRGSVTIFKSSIHQKAKGRQQLAPYPFNLFKNPMSMVRVLR